MAAPNLLSKREAEVVQLLLEGKSNKLIAVALGISNNTVEFHLKNIYAKYQVSSRVELVLKLKDTPRQAETEQLRGSVVAGAGENPENSARPNLWHWAPNSQNWATTLSAAVSKIGKELKMQNVVNSGASNGGNPLTFFEAIRVCFNKYADFTGRASRSEFWWFALFVSLVAAALTVVHEILGSAFLITMLLPLLAAGTRRLRDSGKSGWWQLFLLAPVAGLVLVGILWALPPSPRPDSTPPA